MLLIKIICLLVSVAMTPQIINGVVRSSRVSRGYILVWAMFATAFIVMQWLV